MSTADKLQTIAENVPKVYKAGKQAQHDILWDAIQDNGNRVIYNYAFTGAWTKEAFKPQYDMKPTHAYRMFHNCQINDDLVEILKECGVELDFSNTSGENNYIFTNSLFTRLGVINTTSMSTISQTFMNAKAVTIDKLILKEDGTQNFVATFTGAWQLENITIEGKIGQDVIFNNCTKLTHDSLMSIINALYNYSGTSTTKTLTLGTTNLEKLTDAEKAIATQKGWSLA